MSIVYSKEFLNKIIKYSQNQNINIINIAKKLANRLSREVSGTPEPPNISSEEEQSKLDINSLTNVDNFIKHLADQKVLVDGQRIVFSPKEQNTDANYVPVNIRTGREEFEVQIPENKPITTTPTSTRAFSTADYKVNISLMEKYINFLKNQVKNNKFYLLYINTLIGKIKERIKNINIEKVEESKLDKLNDQDIVDSFLNKIFQDNLKSGNKEGDVKLKVLDIKDITNFNNWLNSDPKAKTEVQGFTSDSYPVFGEDGFDMNKVLQILLQRATRFLQYSTTPLEKNKNTYYKDQISKFLQQFPSEARDKSSEDKAKETEETEETEEIVRQRLIYLQGLINDLPLDIGTIYFNKIKIFMDKYQKFDNRQESIAQQQYNKIINYINNIQKYMISSYSSLNLGQNLNSLSPLLKDGTQDMSYFLTYLNSLISLTSAAISDLKANYGRGLKDTSILDAQMRIANENQAIINKWEQAYKQFARKR